MKTYIIKVFLLLVVISIVILSFIYGKDIPFKQQQPMYDALRTTASIIIAVIGAWLAIIYPERLKLLKNSGESQLESTNGRFSNLFNPIVNSIAILGIVLIVGILAPLLSQIPFFIAHRSLALSCSYAFLSILTIWQIYTIALTLIPMHIVKQVTDDQEDVLEHINRQFPNSR